MRHFPKLCALGLVLVLCVPIAIRISMARWITQELYAFLNTNTQMTLSVDRIKFGVLPGVVRIEGLHLNNAESANLSVKKLYTELSLWSLFVQRRIKFDRIEAAQAHLELDNSKVRTLKDSSSQDFIVGLLQDVMGLQQQNTIFRDSYFDVLQVKDFKVEIDDRLNEQDVHIGLHGDYVGISKVDIEDVDALMRVEAYGYGLNGLAKDFHLSFFISSEERRWGQFKITHLDLPQVDAYLNAKQNAKIVNGYFSMSMLVQRAKDSLRVQMSSQLEDMKMELLRQSVRLKQTQTYLEETGGHVQLNYYLDQEPTGTIVQDVAAIVEEYKREFKRQVLTPSQDNHDPVLDHQE